MIAAEAVNVVMTLLQTVCADVVVNAEGEEGAFVSGLVTKFWTVLKIMIFTTEKACRSLIVSDVTSTSSRLSSLLLRTLILLLVLLTLLLITSLLSLTSLSASKLSPPAIVTAAAVV